MVWEIESGNDRQEPQSKFSHATRGAATLPWGVRQGWLDSRAAGMAARGQQRGFGYLYHP